MANYYLITYLFLNEKLYMPCKPISMRIAGLAFKYYIIFAECYVAPHPHCRVPSPASGRGLLNWLIRVYPT